MSFADALNEILTRADIVDVAGRLGLKLGKREATYTTALCPFHDDRQPSLALYRDKGNPHFYCFACGARGGILDLVDKLRGGDRADNLPWLAREVGVDLPENVRRGRMSVEDLGVLTFSDWLKANHRDDLFRAFAEQRGLDPAVLAAADAYAVDLDDLKINALTPADRTSLERAGVVIWRRQKPAPIATGKQVVFAAGQTGFIFRSLELEDASRKSLRYRFSRGFRKSEALFGANAASARLADDDAGNGLFVVEGIMDALRLDSLGFAAVAVLGTSISRRQAELIRRVCGSSDGPVVPVHLFLDGDEAGRRAAPGALKALIGLTDPLPIDVVRAPEDSDPDELLRDTDRVEACRLLASWTFSVLAVLTHAYTGFPLDTVLEDLPKARPLLRVETLRYLAAQFAGRWASVRDLADPSAVYLGDQPARDASWLRDALDRAQGLDPAPTARPAPMFQPAQRRDDEPDVHLRRALRIAQSSNFRREYPFDWGGMTRLSLAANTTTQVAHRLMRQRGRKAIPYASRLVPKDDGRTRLKAGPWPEDSLVQQYVLSELLRARPETPGWYLEFPAVRLVRSASSEPIMTGPSWLTPVGGLNEPPPVVSFAYQIDQQIVEGESPPVREGMFVPYRECWRQFIDHLDGFVARQPLDTDTFYAVRLDISGFFDNLPRYAVDDVLTRAIGEGAERHFAGRDFAADVAQLLCPDDAPFSEAGNRARADAIARWLTDQSFGYHYFDPSDGRLRAAENPTVGIPQGPDLSAFLANLSLFPVDREVTKAIEAERARRVETGDEAAQPAATYGRYVDDMVIVSTSQSLLTEIEMTIGEALRVRGLSMNAKHERTKALGRRKIREWLVGERGAAVLVSAGGEDTPTTSSATIEELLTVGTSTTRSQVLQLLHHDALYDLKWSTEPDAIRKVEAALQQLRALPSLTLRYYDWVSAARWRLHSLLLCTPDGELETFATDLLRKWRDLYPGDAASTIFGEDPQDRRRRQDHLKVAPLLMLFDAVERLIDSRYDRRTDVDPEVRAAFKSSRERLAHLVHVGDLCGKLIAAAAADAALAPALPLVASMLRVQRLGIRGLAGAIDPNAKPAPVAIDARGPYVERRFALNAMGAWVGGHASPIAGELQDLQTAHGAPEAEPLLALHEAMARLIVDGHPGGLDPLEPMANTTRQNLTAMARDAVDLPAADMDAAVFTLSLVNQFLAEPGLALQAADRSDVLRAFIEIVSGVPEGPALLAARPHLVQEFTGEQGRAIAVPPGVDASAFFVREAEALFAFAFFRNGEAPDVDDILYGVTAAPTNGADGLARYDCTIPPNYRLSTPRQAHLSPGSVHAAHLQEFARAYRGLAKPRLEAPDDGPASADNEPVTPLHLLEPLADGDDWKTFGAVSRLPVGAQAFVRLGPDRLHSLAVHANGAHLWQAGFALADHLGFRGFARSSELDRLTVSTLEPSDTLQALPFYIMQLTVPRLCGALMGRGRHRIDPAAPIPSVIHRQLSRLESFNDADADPIVQLAYLLEAGAEARAADLLRDSPAPLRAPGSLSSVFRSVGRSAARAEKIFTENLPLPAVRPLTNRRSADLWLAAATRLDALPESASSDGVKSVAAALRVVGLARLLQSLALEVWSLLSDEDWRRLGHFVPVVADLDLGDEILLVAGGPTQQSPQAEDQAARLMSVLLDHATPGATARGAMDRVTPLGWVVALATVTGLVDLRRLPSGEAENVSRPELIAARADPRASAKGMTPDERRLWDLLTEIATYLAAATDQDPADILHTAEWPWSVFVPLVDGANDAVTRLVVAMGLIDRLYGLKALTRESRLFMITEADEQGYCLVDREGDGSSNVSGWQVDRDSLGITRLGDIESRRGTHGARTFVWSETVGQGRLVSISIAYRSLADFGGLTSDSAPDAQGEARPSETPATATAAAEAKVVLPLDEPLVAHEISDADAPDLAETADLQGGDPPTSGGKGPPRSDALLELKQLWKAQNKSPRSGARFRPVALRIALLQMNRKQIGHSFYHPICEVAEENGKDWEGVLLDLRTRGVVTKDRASRFEAWRRAILQEALDRCNTLGVELLVLPEYAVRPDTVAWLARELEQRAPSTSVLAGSFRHAARGSPLNYATGTTRPVSLGAVVPLVVPGAALTLEGRDRRESRTFSRLKKYPSIGLSEIMRPEDQPLKAVYETWSDDAPVPERLRYVRDLICSEVFMAMSPANIYSTVPALLDLYARFGMVTNGDAIVSDIMEDIMQIAQDTSPAILRKLSSPRKTILAVPAATTRPFDHHIFGEAGAKAAGLVTVFTNMAGTGWGESCFIGHYKSQDVEGSSIWGLQSPYHGRAPGIWTYKFTGGAPLGDQETALVVADVNPIDTNTSRPARQIENLPISLVAHIPFILGDGTSGEASIRLRAEKVAGEILDLIEETAALGPSGAATSCDLPMDAAKAVRALANALSKIDPTCGGSLKLRAEGLQVGSMQPHRHPKLPVLIDWAFVDMPAAGVDIEVPELEAAELEDGFLKP